MTLTGPSGSNAGASGPNNPWQPWDYREEAGWQGSAYNLTDYRIEATDGEIGKVHQATYDTGASYLVVDTGPWILGRKVMLPAGVVSALDHENQRVMLDLTREQIKNAPPFDPAAANDPAYMEKLGAYYGASAAGATGAGATGTGASGAGTTGSGGS